MKSHFELNDEQFETEFCNGNLNPKLFNHEAHLRLAWIHINKYGFDLATENIQNQIWNYVKKLGAAEKYNTTVTIASIKIVEHFFTKSSSKDFKSFINEFPQIKSNLKELIQSHYSFDIFQNKKAKKEFLPPDLIPFD